MFKNCNFFVLLSAFVLVYGSVSAQETRQPKQPMAPRIELITNDGGSYLGIQTQEVTKENFSKFGLSGVRGVAVEKVMDDSPAKQAGLQDGDVIVRFNGEEVTGYRKLTRLISETAPDHQAKLVVVRGGSEREVTVTMGKRQMPQFEMGNFEMNVPKQLERVFERTMPAPGFKIEGLPKGDMGDVFVWNGEGDGRNFVFGSTRQIGVGVSSLTKQLGEYFGVTDGNGLLVNNVNDNSPAAKAGLKAGDVIVEVEGKAVGNTMDLIRGISEKKEGEVALTILRNRSRQTIKVTPERTKEGENNFIFRQPNGSIRVEAAPRIRVTAPARIAEPARSITVRRIL